MATNLLQNGDFEADWGDDKSHCCLIFPVGGEPYETDVGNIFTPSGGWVTWFCHDPGTWDQPEVRDAWASGDSRRVHSGQKGTLLFTFYRKHDAGFLQQVQVEPGKQLRLTAWTHAWSNHGLEGHESCKDDARCSCGVGRDVVAIPADEIPPLNGDAWNDAVGNFLFSLGIDPTGGTNPYADTVVWGESYAIYNGYAHQLSVEAVAQSSTVTVFLRSITLWGFKHNDAYWDDAELVIVDEEPPAPPPYESTMLVLPQDATAAQLHEILTSAYSDRRTFGFSHDDAGHLNGTAILYNIPTAEKQAHVDFYATRYPNVTVEFAYTSDWEEVAPPPSTGPLVSLHLQTQVEGCLDFVARVKPRVVKIFQLEVAEEIKARSPDTLVVLRYFEPHQNLDGDLRESAREYVAKFRDSLITNAEWIDYVESYNETVCSNNADSIRCAVEFDCHFADALMALGLPVAPQLLNVAVGNPLESEVELLLPAVRKAIQYSGTIGYHAYGQSVNKSNFNDAWQYLAGRALEGWDPVFRSRGLYPLYVFGECGAFADCSTGWRAAACLNGDWALYLSMLTEFSNRIEGWNAAHGNRCLGGTLFTSGGWGWDSFEIRQPQMEDPNWPT